MGVIVSDSTELPVAADNYKGLVDVLLLCTRCQQPIKARINTPNWIRCEWIGVEGECLKCHQEAKDGRKGSDRNSQR